MVSGPTCKCSSYKVFSSRCLIDGLVQGSQRNDCMLDEELLLRSLEYNMRPERTVEVFSKIRSSCIAEQLEVSGFFIVAE